MNQIKTMKIIEVNSWLKEQNYLVVKSNSQWWYHKKNDEWSKEPKGPGWSLGIPVKKVILGEL